VLLCIILIRVKSHVPSLSHYEDSTFSTNCLISDHGGCVVGTKRLRSVGHSRIRYLRFCFFVLSCDGIGWWADPSSKEYYQLHVDTYLLIKSERWGPQVKKYCLGGYHWSGDLLKESCFVPLRARVEKCGSGGNHWSGDVWKESCFVPLRARVEKCSLRGKYWFVPGN
jgi:hypothetical protein